MKLINNISDTAKWVAFFRAEESERPDALFHDPYARRLAGDQGEKIAERIEMSRINSWSFVARTFLFDEFIMRFVSEGYDTVINLAAGLDSRAYRMELPSSLRWIEVDLPGILQYKQEIMNGEKPRCDFQSIELDLADRDARMELFKRLSESSDKALIVTEGLISYLTEEQAGEFATDLSAQPHFRHWIFDMMSPGLLAMVDEKMNPYLKEANAVLQFAPKEGEAFFIQYGWNPVESRSKLKTAAGLNRLTPEQMNYAAIPEPEGPKGSFPWSGVCLFENIVSNKYLAG